MTISETTLFLFKKWQAIAASSLTLFAALNSWSANAQIAPDATLPNPTTVNREGQIHHITGGTTAGNNLFHSFREFSVPTGGTAYFDNALTIQNIFSRVTGTSISNIDGLIRANGTANLFFINPNGIIFGANAQLNIGGSFLATTADRLVFSDRTSFSATNPEAPPLLTVSVPIGLQMGQNPGNIAIQGPGLNQLGLSERQAIIQLQQSFLNNPLGLRVQPERTLALVGGNLTLEGGLLKAQSGRIELGSARDGFVDITPTLGRIGGFALGYQRVSNFGDIQLSQQSGAIASGEGGGIIQVQARRLSLTSGSAIATNTLGSEPGGNLAIRASESVELSGTTPDGRNATGLLAATFGPSNAGSLAIDTGQLIVRDGAQIGVGTNSEGEGGNLTVRARESVKLSGANSFLAAATNGTGDAGKITIETGQLTIQNGASLLAATFLPGTGKGGTVTIRADAVELTGNAPNDASNLLSKLSNPTPNARFSNSLIGAASVGGGNAGEVTIETRRLILRDGAGIGVGAITGENLIPGVSGARNGRGGNLTIRASESVEISGRSPDGLSSGLLAGTNTTGNGGDVRIETGQFLLEDGSQVSVGGQGTGNPGSIQIAASATRLLNEASLTATSATGVGGNINVRSPSIELRGSKISAAGSDNGNITQDGNINLNAQTVVLLQNSHILTSAADPRGGSNITINPLQGSNLVVLQSPDSTINAVGELNVEGAVAIAPPEVPEVKVRNVEGLIASSCDRVEGNEFTIAGRGGLPPSPNQPLSSAATVVQWATPFRREGEKAGVAQHPSSIPHQLVEATGWIVAADGNVILTANAHSSQYRPGWINPVCRPQKFPLR